LSEKVVEVKNLSMKYNLAKEEKASLKNYFKRIKNRELLFQEFWALNDISFDVEKGDRLAILGLNGAGKSTLLKAIAGVQKPSKGTIKVKGRVVPLLEMSGGFTGSYTGRENIFLRGAMLGFSTKAMEDNFNEIVEFSGLKDFLDVPVNKYSSGMRARLGFSISTVVDPDILILDEVLSVGDAKFKRKSFDKMMSLIENNDTTVLFVSHSINQVKKLCNKAILLDKGKLIMKGNVEEVCDKYEEIVNS